MTKRLFTVSLILPLAAGCYAATFGKVVPVRGTPADIALDEARGRLYIADFAAGRVDVMKTADLTFDAPLPVSEPPSSIALSPDGHFLVVGLYYPFPTSPASPPSGGFAVFDLQKGVKQEVTIGSPVLAVAFGAGSSALVVTSTQFLLLDPVTARTQTLGVTALEAAPLPVNLGTFPPDIVQASTGVSGDGQRIVILAELPSEAGAAVLQYHVGDASVTALAITSTPQLGPRAASVNKDGSAFVAGWVLWDFRGVNRAQFPYPIPYQPYSPPSELRQGGYAFDYSRNLIYADVPVSAGEAPVLHVVDSDNLTVRERIQLPQMMAGRSLFSSDMQTLYAVSDSGVMVLPVRTLAKAHRVGALQEDVVFQTDACNRNVVSQPVDIVDLGGGSTDFTLSLPPNTAGIRLSQTSGTTPARISVEVDPTVYQNAKGTTTVTLSLQSSNAINIPFPVRLLINTRDFNQRGSTVNVPGKIVDVIADRVRNRVYLIRQDKNLVLVYDSSTLSQVAALRTGNTPVGMAITDDQRYLLVGNDNSQLASVFDLETLQPSDPILFPNAYPRSIAVAHGAIWAVTRGVLPPLAPSGAAGAVFRVDFAARIANAPPSLGVYCNDYAPPNTGCIPETSTLSTSPSGLYVLLATPDGKTAMWDSSVDLWVVSRKDLGTVGGAYAALSDNRFLVDNNLLDESLYPVAKLQTGTGSSSGAGFAAGAGLRTTTTSAAGPGTLERIDLVNLQSFHATPTIEAPEMAATLNTVPIGQIGQTILPFTRTLAVPADQRSILLLTQSGITVLSPDFDAPTTAPAVSSVASLADGTSGVAPGGLIAISGTGLAPGSAVANALPLPTSLGEACATVNNVALPLFWVSPTQFAAQLPFSVTGAALLIVRDPGGLSAPYSLHIQDSAPSIFRSGAAGDETGLATVVRFENNELVTFTNPIHTNEWIIIYLTGLGLTSPAAPLGDAAPWNPLALAVSPPTVTIGGTPLALAFAGLTPGSVGVYQINAYVPGAVRGASQTPLVITQGQASTTLQVRVVNP